MNKSKIIKACLIVFVSLLFSQSSIFAMPKTLVNCKINPLYCRMLILRPHINKIWAMRFSDLVYKYAKKNNMDPWRSLAIAMQESSLRQIHRKHMVIIFYKDCSNKKDKSSCKDSYKIIRGFSDLSVFQFHIDTVVIYGLDPIRLNDDLNYVVRAHFKVLKDKMKICSKLGEKAWMCYHSKTRDRRLRYGKLVDRYYFGRNVSAN